MSITIEQMLRGRPVCELREIIRQATLILEENMMTNKFHAQVKILEIENGYIVSVETKDSMKHVHCQSFKYALGIAEVEFKLVKSRHDEQEPLTPPPSCATIESPAGTDDTP